jgi:hypothetical protein
MTSVPLDSIFEDREYWPRNIFAKFFARAALPELLYVSSVFSEIIFSPDQLGSYMGSKKSFTARKLCFFAFRGLKQPLEIRKRIFFEMLKRKQRVFVEMVFEMRREGGTGRGRGAVREEDSGRLETRDKGGEDEKRRNSVEGSLEEKRMCGRARGQEQGTEDEEDILSWKNEKGEGPLLALSHVRGRTDRIALFLLREGADPREQNENGETPLSVAKKLRNKEFQAVLLEFIG